MLYERETVVVVTSTSSVTEGTNLFSVFYSKHRVLDLIRLTLRKVKKKSTYRRVMES